MSFSDYYGLDLLWFLGVVEDRKDPLKIGRCKVRCFGFHTENLETLPTEDLPWAQLLIPANSDYEIKPPKECSWVVGFFKDGKYCQEPMILSLLPGIPTVPAEEGKEKYIDEESKQEKEESKPKEVGFYDLGKDKGTRPFPPKGLKYNTSGKKISIEQGESDLYPTVDEGYLKQPIEEPDTVRVARNDENDKFLNLDTQLPKDSHIDKVKEFRIGGQNFETNGIKKTLSQDTVCAQSAYSKSYSKNQNIDRTSSNAEEIDDGKRWKEKETKYKTDYPYNKVEQSESGHVFEIDDTPGSERIHQQHRSGTFYEIHPDGSKVEKVMADNFHFVQQNEYKLNLGNYEITIKKNKGECVEGDVFINIDGKRSLRIGGNSYVEVEGNDSYVTRKNREQTTRENKDETVYKNRTEVVKQDHTETVEWNQTQTFGTRPNEHKKTETVNGSRSETVMKNHTEDIRENKTITVGGNHTEDVQGNKTVTVGGSHKETVSGTHETESSGTMTLKAPKIYLN